MKKIIENLFSNKVLHLISIGAISFLLGYSLQKNEFIKSKLKEIFLEAHYKAIKQPNKVLCPKDSLVVVYFGQSNSAGYVKPFSKSIIPNNLIQFDWRTGDCYQYKEPLLGSEGRWGNSITNYGILMANKVDYPVVIVPFGKAGSSVGVWAYGYLFKHYELVIDKLKMTNLTPNIFLWHQGENDARSFNADETSFYKLPYFKGPSGSKFMFGTSTLEYERALSKIIMKSKKEFPESYFGVALVSRCGKNRPWESIRRAQKNSTRLFEKVFISADSDSIYGLEYRYDGCHFSNLGAKKLGEMYFESTSSVFDFNSIKFKNK
tara:strand:+ start:1933 stop:2892 length:960 start_codon:yes stop_codon:yes gene_type:complete